MSIEDEETAEGCAGSKARLVLEQETRVRGVEAVDVLLRLNRRGHVGGARPFREGELDQDPMDPRIPVEAAYLLDQLGLGDPSRQLDQARLEAAVSGCFPLVAGRRAWRRDRRPR